MASAVSLCGWIRSMTGVTFRAWRGSRRTARSSVFWWVRRKAMRWLAVGDTKGGLSEWSEVPIVSSWPVLSGIGAVKWTGGYGSFGWIKAFRRSRYRASRVVTPAALTSATVMWPASSWTSLTRPVVVGRALGPGTWRVWTLAVGAFTRGVVRGGTPGLPWPGRCIRRRDR